MAQFASKFKEDTNWDIYASSAINDEKQGLYSFSASLGDGPGLGFYVIKKGKSRIVKQRIRSVHNAFNTRSLKEVLNCTAYVTLFMTVSIAIGTKQVPSPADDFKAKIKFHIVGVDALGTVKSVAPGSVLQRQEG
jgi:hypothetical protein